MRVAHACVHCVCFFVLSLPLFCSQAHEELAAAIFIGADGLRRFVRGGTSGWGSVSDRVVRRTRTTVVCVQPKGAIYA